MALFLVGASVLGLSSQVSAVFIEPVTGTLLVEMLGGRIRLENRFMHLKDALPAAKEIVTEEEAQQIVSQIKERYAAEKFEQKKVYIREYRKFENMPVEYLNKKRAKIEAENEKRRVQGKVCLLNRWGDKQPLPFDVDAIVTAADIANRSDFQKNIDERRATSDLQRRKIAELKADKNKTLPVGSGKMADANRQFSAIYGSRFLMQSDKVYNFYSQVGSPFLLTEKETAALVIEWNKYESERLAKSQKDFSERRVKVMSKSTSLRSPREASGL